MTVARHFVEHGLPVLLPRPSPQPLLAANGMPLLLVQSRRRSQIAGISMPFFFLQSLLPVLLPVAVASPFGVVAEGAPGMDVRYNCAAATPEGGAEAACIERHP